jgi:flagellin-like protein
MRTITKLRRNSKALSPIFATLILIAIAVIAGIVVYMFTSGTIASLTGGGGAATEKMAIQGISGTAPATGTQTITVYAMSTEGGAIPLDSAIIKDSAGTVKAVIAKANIDDTGTTGTQATVNTVLTTLAITNIPAGTMTAGNSYTVTLVSVAGGSFPSTSFKPT